jgi:hypothetical protein
MHVRWQVFQQEGDEVVNWSGVEDVVIVQHEGEFVSSGCDFVDECGQHRCVWRRLARLERSQQPLANIWHHRL